MSGTRSLPVVQLLIDLLLLAWPFLIWFGLAHNSPHWLLPLVTLLLFLRFCQTRRQTEPLRVMTQVVAVAGITLCIVSYPLRTHQLPLFYPVVVDVVMLSVFGGSLWSAMPTVECLARLCDSNPPDAGVRYTRCMTQIWCAFFTINGSVALFTAPNGDMTLWITWNGIASYLSTGTLMVGEWLIRQLVIKRDT